MVSLVNELFFNSFRLLSKPYTPAGDMSKYIQISIKKEEKIKKIKIKEIKNIQH
jgi:hypothetical protein